MRSTRLVLLLSVTLTAASCSIFHRDKPAPVVETVRTESSPAPPTAARDLADVMSTELKLSSDQTTRVRAVLNSTLKDSNAAKQRLPAQSSQLLAELKRININSQKELRTVIGPEKFKLLQTRGVQQKIAADMQQKQ